MRLLALCTDVSVWSLHPLTGADWQMIVDPSPDPPLPLRMRGFGELRDELREAGASEKNARNAAEEVASSL